MDKRVLLMILDGWGIPEDPKVSAIDHAKTPFMDQALAKYPNSHLQTAGLAVGLPEGQMGNSEVGHMNIGAGRVVYQMLVRINQAVKEQTLLDQPALAEAFAHAKANHKKVHLMGLVSDGGVHSHINHLKGLLDAAKAAGLTDVFVHAFMDGRDTSPHGGIAYLEELKAHTQSSVGKIASVVGRYYAMDRDKRWERVKLAYDLLVHGKGKASSNIIEDMQASYNDGITDEFIKPIVAVDDNGVPVATISEGDVVLCFNFRTDRGRQITQALTQHDFSDQDMQKRSLYYLTMTEYDETFKDIRIVFENEFLTETLGEVLAKAGKRQLRIAETEKYPHVTFFFSGGNEQVFDGEYRILCDSPKVATYDLQPEMSADCLRDKIIEDMRHNEQPFDFACLNFANPDMVGHTGDFEAAVKACETVDRCAGDVVKVAIAQGYAVLIISDHGNADKMQNPDGSPHTAHTPTLVPCVLIGEDRQLKNGKLGDVAPTVLEIMGLEKPAAMTGESLLV